ncbi:MAG: nuclear transport factor 2 family protein [Holophagaceae bacterium]
MFHPLRRMPAVISVALLALALLACGPQTPGSDRALAAQLKAQAEAWDQAILRKDAPAIAENLTADFRHIGKGGDLADRATFLRDLLSPDLVIHPYTVEDFDVRIYGDCALLCGRTRMTGTYQGRPFTSHYRYIDTYVRQDGRWRVCSVQITAMAD